LLLRQFGRFLFVPSYPGMGVESSQRSGGDHGLMHFTPHVAPHCAAATRVTSSLVKLVGELENQPLEFMSLRKYCAVVLWVATSTRCVDGSFGSGCETVMSLAGMTSFWSPFIPSALFCWPTSCARAIASASVGATVPSQYTDAPASAAASAPFC